MSGEFGEYLSGYFHDKVSSAAEDCRNGQSRGGELTGLWGEVLTLLVPVARGISWYEACDSGYDYPVQVTLDAVPKLREALGKLDAAVRIYKEVADDAVRAYIRAQGEKP